MTAMERRIFAARLVVRAQAYMFEEEQDRQRTSCFERTGCLVTKYVEGEKDKMSIPRGLTIPWCIPITSPIDVVPIEYMQPNKDDEEYSRGCRANT